MWFVLVFRQYPELAIFLTLALGFFIGPLKLGKFSLGTVTAVLLMGVLIGQMDIPVAPDVKSVFFLLFLFAVGYSVGPQFFRGLKKEGISQMVFAAVVCVVCLVVPWLCARLMGYNAGQAAGLLAGAQTISAVIGVASDTINQLNIEAAAKTSMVNAIPVCYAVTYLFGTAGSAWVLASLGPRLLGGLETVRRQSKELEAQMGSGGEFDEPGMIAANPVVSFRAYHITNDWFANGQTIQEIEKYLLQQGRRLFAERIRRRGQVVEPSPSTKVFLNDDIVLSGRRESLVGESNLIGPEIMDMELLHFPAEVLNVLISKKEIDGLSVKQIRQQSYMHGVFIRDIRKADIPVPVLPDTQLDRGDMLQLVGTRKDVEMAASKLGYPDRATNKTDMLFVGLGIVVGGLVGAITFHIGGVPLSLSTSGGALIAGLFFGWLRSQHPSFGRIPEPALWVMNNVGLNLFIAVVGITAGPSFVQGFKEAGVGLFVAGAVATTVPLVCGLLIGRYLFKFHPALTLGCTAGARTTTAALGAIQDAIGSKTPALGYTVTYAVGNTLLIIWGVVIVLLTQ